MRLPFFIFFFCTFALAENMTIDGFRAERESQGAPADPQKILLRTAGENHLIDLGRVDADLRRRLLAARADTSIRVTIPRASVRTTPVPMGIRPDCSELPTNYDALARTAASPAVDSQQAFLNSLAPGTMQTFTLLFESESALRSGISTEYPGVMRMSADGKLMLRYACDPRSPAYGKVEMIRFTGGRPAFVFSEFDFNKPAGSRVTEQPTSCLRCHNQNRDVVDPRPNWNMYPDWPGFVGSHDDHFPNTPDKQEEKRNFETFKREKKDSPCYAGLPWPKGPVPPEYVNYPYGVGPRSLDYNLRPNLKFTEIPSHLLGVRNFNRLKDSPDYERIKRLLALEAAQCEVPNLHEKLRELLPGYAAPNPREIRVPRVRGHQVPRHEPRHPAGKAQGLFGVSIALGFRPGDWTMNFGEANRSDYATGSDPGESQFAGQGDLPLTAYVQHEILKDVARNVPGLGEQFTQSRGESAYFGKQFGCIDDIAGATEFRTPEAKRRACALLIEEAARFEAGGLPPLRGGRTGETSKGAIPEPFQKSTPPERPRGRAPTH